MDLFRRKAGKDGQLQCWNGGFLVRVAVGFYLSVDDYYFRFDCSIYVPSHESVRQNMIWIVSLSNFFFLLLECWSSCQVLAFFIWCNCSLCLFESIDFHVIFFDFDCLAFRRLIGVYVVSDNTKEVAQPSANNEAKGAQQLAAEGRYGSRLIQNLLALFSFYNLSL